jgi:hypothetical protein
MIVTLREDLEIRSSAFSSEAVQKQRIYIVPKKLHKSCGFACTWRQNLLSVRPFYSWLCKGSIAFQISLIPNIKMDKVSFL